MHIFYRFDNKLIPKQGFILLGIVFSIVCMFFPPVNTKFSSILRFHAGEL